MVQNYVLSLQAHNKKIMWVQFLHSIYSNNIYTVLRKIRFNNIMHLGKKLKNTIRILFIR